MGVKVLNGTVRNLVEISLNKVQNKIITMAAKGKAAKSSSGASMSQYDVEVEKRLGLLEADAASAQSTLINVQETINEIKSVVPYIQKQIDELKNPVTEAKPFDDLEGLEKVQAQLDDLDERLHRKFNF